ncbi:MAG: pyrroline-5-carboxylate reductase [Phycisphaerae bacterium]|nr:pyrroline-5-carboxylate reductase [Phycisphaerae bacterium]
MPTYELAFIGAGNMAEAIVRGVLSAGLLKAEDMIVSDPAQGRRDLFAGLGLADTADNGLAARAARRLVLAVKPQKMAETLAELGPVIAADTLVISIAAGWSSAKIEAGLGAVHSEFRIPNSAFLPRVVRVMPNTPMLAGAGVSGLVKGKFATDDDLAWAVRLFQSAGRTVVLNDEGLIDAVTAVSGSGPAYFFYLIEQMAAAGVEEGLSEADALLLATETCAGSAKLLTQSGASPRELRRRVTSPNGTTQAATDLLDARGVAESLRAAVRAAAERSRELGK